MKGFVNATFTILLFIAVVVLLFTCVIWFSTAYDRSQVGKIVYEVKDYTEPYLEDEQFTQLFDECLENKMTEKDCTGLINHTVKFEELELRLIKDPNYAIILGRVKCYEQPSYCLHIKNKFEEIK